MKILLNKKPYRKETELTEMTDEQQCQFVIWILKGMSCEKAYTELKDKLGLKKISIHQVKRYWQGESPAVLDWQRFRKKRVSPVAWEMNRRSALKKLEDPNLPFEERIAIMKYLETGRLQKTKDEESAPAKPPQNKKPRENEPGSAEENPLDDDAKLEEVRLAVFGPAPGEELPASNAAEPVVPADRSATEAVSGARLSQPQNVNDTEADRTENSVGNITASAISADAAAGDGRAPDNDVIEPRALTDQ